MKHDAVLFPQDEESTKGKKSNKSDGESGAPSSRVSKRGMTNGFADPQRNYDGNYNGQSAPKPAPPAGEVTETGMPLPKRNDHGELVFADQKEFR